jgi:hypothetical protein
LRGECDIDWAPNVVDALVSFVDQLSELLRGAAVDVQKKEKIANRLDQRGVIALGQSFERCARWPVEQLEDLRALAHPLGNSRRHWPQGPAVSHRFARARSATGAAQHGGSDASALANPPRSPGRPRAKAIRPSR